MAEGDGSMRGRSAPLRQDLPGGPVDVSGEPSAVGQWNHAVQFSLPDRDWRANAFQGETPGTAEGKIVVNPTVKAVCQRSAEDGGDVIGNIITKHASIHFRNQTAQSIGDFFTRDRAIPSASRHPGSCCLFSFDRLAELRHVLLRHACEEVEIFTAIRPDPRHSCSGATPRRQDRHGRQGRAGPPPDQPSVTKDLYPR